MCVSVLAISSQKLAGSHREIVARLRDNSALLPYVQKQHTPGPCWVFNQCLLPRIGRGHALGRLAKSHQPCDAGILVETSINI